MVMNMCASLANYKKDFFFPVQGWYNLVNSIDIFVKMLFIIM